MSVGSSSEVPRQAPSHLSPIGSPPTSDLFKPDSPSCLDFASLRLSQREDEREKGQEIEREAHEYKKECERRWILEGVRQIYASRFITMEVQKTVSFIGGKVFQIDTTDGNQYVGECSHRKIRGPEGVYSTFPDGIGTLKTAAGTCYHGEWVVNFPHGRGEMILSNDLIVKGEWEDGQLKWVYR